MARLVPATPLADILEKDWQHTVVDLARALGWKRIYHTHDSRRSAHGFPDLVLVRDRVIYLELKREKTQPTPEQIEWLRAFHDAGAEVYLARPSHLEYLADVLSRRQQPDGHPLRDELTAVIATADEKGIAAALNAR